MVKFEFLKCKDSEAALLELFVGGVINYEVWEAFLAVEPTTLAEARKEARLKEVICDAVYTSSSHVLTNGSSSKSSRDMTTQTHASGPSCNGYCYQQWYRSNGFQRRPNQTYYQRPQHSQNTSRVGNTIGEREYRLTPTHSLSNPLS